ncbi:MAG: G-D-S-L family lipolytic protein [Bacteroidetes bacterium]|jgi:lysophospholipase L1-like esterase|nr:G-D-S-L family lipolytic protein [Bacteroidota bacterium]
MKKYIFPTLALAATFLLSSCSHYDFDTDVNNMSISQGTANFTKYIALGNSLTSGYRDGTLYSDGQNESYPNMIASSMQRAGGAMTFKQPMIPNNIGGFQGLAGFPGKLTLQVVNGKLTPVASPAAAPLDNIASSGPYQNLGVPGAKSFHLGITAYGMMNPYYARFSTGVSPVAAAVAQAPTFFSLWIGNNDVLSYATSGGVGTDQTGNTNPATYGSNDITDPGVLIGSITQYVTALTAGGAKGVLANIPNVTAIPFFTTVPYNPLTKALLGNGDEAVGQANITALNAQLYGPLKQALTAFGAGSRINLLSSTDPNPLLIKDVDLPNLSAQLTAALTPSLGAATATAFGQIYGQARQATANDYVLLTTSGVIGTAPVGTPPSINKYGISYPLENEHVLSQIETNKVMTATTAYNTSIKNLATTKGLAFVDANSKMNELASVSGITFDGVKFTTKFVTGGAFSLDGVHLTGKGYAIIANEFIKAINQKYQSTLPQVNIYNYSGVTFPQ